MQKTIKLPGQHRQAALTLATKTEGDEDETFELSFSSEEPYERWWGVEILGHKGGEVKLDWMKTGRAPLLVDHDMRVDSQVGTLSKVWLEDGRGKAIGRFGKNARSQEIMARVKAGDLSNVSVGYRIEEMVLVKEEKNGPATYRVTKWTPYEASIVAVPADQTVGVGRSATTEENEVRIITQPSNRSIPTMEPIEQTTTTHQPGVLARNSGGQWYADPNGAPPKAETPEAIRVTELKRITDIEALGSRFNKGALAREHIAKGTDTASFRSLLLDAVGFETFNEKNINANSLGLTRKEAQQFRFTRLIAGLMDPRQTELRELAAFELDVVNSHMAKTGRVNSQKRGLAVPFDVLRTPLVENTRDLTVGVPTAGGNVVATNLLTTDFITLLRSRMMVERMGARMLMGLEGNVAIPRQTGGATGYWVAENGALTESQQTFDQVAMNPKTYGAFTDWSRRLMLQASLDVEAFVRLDIATTLALGVDMAALHGTGAASQPLGLSGQAGINVVALGANGAAPNWANIVQMETEVAVDNADIGSLGYLTNAKVRGKLKTTEKAATTGLFLWPEGMTPDGMGLLNGYRAGVSNQVKSDLVKGASGAVCSGIFYGNWADMIIGSWSGLDMLVDPYTQATAGTVRAVAFIDVDVAIRNGGSFSYVADALTV